LIDKNKEKVRKISLDQDGLEQNSAWGRWGRRSFVCKDTTLCSRRS